MKRIIILLLCFLLFFIFTGCSGDNSKTSTNEVEEIALPPDIEIKNATKTPAIPHEEQMVKIYYKNNGGKGIMQFLVYGAGKDIETGVRDCLKKTGLIPVFENGEGTFETEVNLYNLLDDAYLIGVYSGVDKDSLKLEYYYNIITKETQDKQ